MRPPVLKREGRRERKKQEARAALLDAALALFGERGHPTICPADDG
jgi:AcrR family transcriptional regulator